jgi:hypothetical protein
MILLLKHLREGNIRVRHGGFQVEIESINSVGFSVIYEPGYSDFLASLKPWSLSLVGLSIRSALSGHLPPYD